jgi:hypothetical protein
MIRNPVIGIVSLCCFPRLVGGTGHNCTFKAQVFRITTQMGERSLLQRVALFGMIGEIKWTK